MDFALSEEHKMIQDLIRKFGTEVEDKIKELDEKAEYDPNLIKRMGELGILGLCFPQKYNGGGFDYISLAVASEELEKIDTSLRVAVSVHIGLSGLGILQWGNEEQKLKYLSKMATGELIGGFGLTEPNAGTDAVNQQTTARKVEGGYILNGEKTWISLADVADIFLVFAKTDTTKGHDGISAFIVERSWEGFSSSPIHGKMGIRAGNTGSFAMENVFVPEENLLGEEGQGFKIAMSCLDNGRYTVAAGAVGLTQACIDASVKYAKERETFGVPIGDHQLVQRMIGHMVLKAEAGRLLVYRAGYLKNQGKRNTRETALAKWYATQSSFEAASDAVQIYGAYGYSNEYPVERYLRNAKGAVIYEGTREILEVMQGQYALGYRKDKPIPRDLPGWPFEEDAE